MIKGNNVRIEQEGHGITKVLIDDIELKGVQNVEYKNGIGTIPYVTVEFIPETLNCDKEDELNLKISIDSDVIAEKIITKLNKQAKLQGCKVNV